MPEDDALVGRRVGGYDVLAVLGRGAFATVYRARQVRLGRDVALKVLDPLVARNPELARRFDREGAAAAGLDHPAIVPVFEAGEDDGVWYLAMRLVDGQTLGDALAAASGFPWPDTVRVVDEVAAALDHAHSRGVLHRDVKPANILLEGHRVWLSDFGIAATTQQVGQYTTGSLGTAAYMAPEQSRPGEADHRADLYSLGCVAYECATGRPPFSGYGVAGLLHAHLTEAVPPAGSEGLDAFFRVALAKDPDDRFQTGATLAGALSVALDGAALVAKAPRHRRRRWPAAAAVAVIIAAAGGAVALAGGNGPHKGAAVTSTTTTTGVPQGFTESQAADAYVSSVATVNAAQSAFQSRYTHWTSATTPARAQADAHDFLAAVVAVQSALNAVAAKYAPAAAAINADILAAADIQRDLLLLNSLNATVTTAIWDQQYAADLARLTSASDKVRTALGLPPVQA